MQSLKWINTNQTMGPSLVPDSCLLPRAEGPCSERQARWFYDQSERRCMPFYYGGCQGNANNYESEDACQQSCRALSLVTG